MQNFEELEEDMNNLGDDCQEPFLTRQDYEKSLNTEYRSNNDESINITEDYAYQGITDNIMVELQQKYNLRPRDRNITTAQPKKILSKSKANETAQPVS
jgi:rRNA maturation endonuclease Nob1